MPKILIISLFALCSQLLQAQKPPIKFGEIPMAQLTMKRYDKDSSASAVVLADYAESILEYNQNTGFVLKFERLRRIKILTKDGLGWADFSVPLYHDASNDEKLSALKAVTYNLENGKIVETKLKNDAVFKEKYDANLDFTKITLPNVKEGSVIEITYRITSDFIFNFQDWEFQNTIPTVWSEYRARIPEYFNYEKYMQGYVVLDVSEETTERNAITLTSKERTETHGTNFSSEKIDFTENRFRWAAKDVPAFKSEPAMTTYRDYISKLNFELSFTKFPDQPIKNYMGSWTDINKTYAESDDFGGQITGNGFLRNVVEQATVGRSTPEEKIGAICNYVKQTITWDGANRTHVTTSLKKVMEEKKGNSAEINLLLASMLEKADIQVLPVLLSTRDHGFIREATPVSSQFNYVVCLVRLGDKQMLLDATDKLLPTGTLPEKCLNGNGFVVSKNGFEWVKLQPNGKSRRVVNADLILENAGELKGKLLIERTGYYAQGSRKSYFSKGEADYLKDFKGGRSWELSKSEYQNVGDVQQPFKEAHEVTIADHITSTGEMIYLSPFVMDQEEENPFKLEKREYPVDFGSPFDNTYLLKITVPDTYNVEELPKAKAFSLPNGAAKYFFNVVQTGNIISISSTLAVNRSLFGQDEYVNLREFYNQVVAKQAEQIVLKENSRMREGLGFLFVATAICSMGGDLKFPVSEIPEGLTKGVNAVIREDKMVYRVLSQSRASVYAYYAVTIFNGGGKAYASRQVDYDKLTKVISFNGSVYDATGKLIRKLKSNEIKDYSAYDGGLYSDNRLKTADLAQGTYPYTVVFEYEKEYKFLYMIDGTVLVPDEKISVQHASYQLIYPAAIPPRYSLRNIDSKPRKELTSDGVETLTWEFSSLPPITFEPLSSWRDVVPQIMAAPTKFEFDGYAGNMQTWDEFGRWINTLNKGRNVLPEGTKMKIIQLTAGLKTTAEKTKAVYEFMQNKTRYVSIQLGIGGFQPFEASVVDQTGYGDCKALSNYTIALLEAAGVKANYALIMAGKNAPKLIADFPSSQFNHAIAFVPNGTDTLWLECTSQTNPFGYSGWHTGDRDALAITENGAKIVKTPSYSAEDNLQSRTADVFVLASGHAKAKVKTTYSGLQYETGSLSFILENQYDDQKKWIQNNTNIPSFDINSFSMINIKNRIPSAIVVTDLTLNRLATVSGKRLFLTPNLMNRSTFVPEKVEARKTKVVRKMAYLDVDTIRFNIPEEIYPEFLPEPTKITSRFGVYEATYRLDQGKLIYIRRVKMNKGEFPPESYAELIDFYRNINKADNVKIVFLTKT